MTELEKKIEERLLKEGYIPRAMQDDSGNMVTIPEPIRRQ